MPELDCITNKKTRRTITSVSNTPDRIIGKAERRTITGISDTTWWRYEGAGLVPRRVQLTRGRVGYRLQEILAWVESRQTV